MSLKVSNALLAILQISSSLSRLTAISKASAAISIGVIPREEYGFMPLPSLIPLLAELTAAAVPTAVHTLHSVIDQSPNDDRWYILPDNRGCLQQEFDKSDLTIMDIKC